MKFPSSMKSRYFRGDRRFSLVPSDYKVVPATHTCLPANREETPHLASLLCEGKEIAASASAILPRALDIRVLQGVRGAYRPLCCVK